MAKGRKTFRKVITSDTLTAQINKDNIKLMERFLKNFATKRSPKSVTVYRSNILMFLTWNLLENDNKSFEKIRKIEFADFFDYTLTELKHSPNRFANLHSSLSSFSDWIENYLDDDERYKDFRNLVKKIEKPVKENVREKTVLKKEDIDKIFSTLEEQNRVQEQCLLALAISCGARVSELARFTLDLINEENTVFDGLFLETTKKISTKGRGANGGKWLNKYILKDMFLPYYHKWIEVRKDILEENNIEEDHGFMFVTRDGLPASADRLRDWMGSWGDIVGRPSYPHLYRHYNISAYKLADIPDELIVYLTGWSEGSGHTMIAIYDDTELKDKKIKNLDKLKTALDNGNI